MLNVLFRNLHWYAFAYVLLSATVTEIGLM
jgi:hypothetical protein